MKNMQNPHVTAIILAAGMGSRMGSETTKQRMCIHGESVLYRSVKAFNDSEKIASIIVVCREDEIDWARAETADFDKIFAIVIGGKTRAESAIKGFFAIPDECELVAIHDGARCLVSGKNIADVVDMALLHGAATACTPLTDTLKGISQDLLIDHTIPRDGLYLAQTPQAFDRALYSDALKNAKDVENITDDNMLLEMIGLKIYPVDTGRSNIKITTAEDIAYAEFILERNKAMNEFRVGHGYDVHRLVENRSLIICGVNIPFEKGLLGHSDADVLIHAIMDALLGAAGLGDIGRHFPDNDNSYLGISSLILLSKVAEMLKKNGYSVVNIDATIVAQRPKMAGYIDEMKRNISNILAIELSRTNIKATTEEGLGFTGSGEGIAAHAIVSIKK